MLKTHWRIISWIERIADNLLIVASFFAAYLVREEFLGGNDLLSMFLPALQKELAPLNEYLIILGVALPIYNASLSIFGGYRSMRFSGVWPLFRLSLLCSVIVFLSEGSILYLLKLDLSRAFVATFCGVSGIALFVERLLVLQYLRYWRMKGRNYRNILIVGTGEQARRVYLEVTTSPELGVRVVGFVTFNDELHQQQMRVGNNEQGNGVGRNDGVAAGKSSAVYDLPARVIASPATFETVLKKFAVDEVLFTDIIEGFAQVQDLAQIAVEEGVRVTIAADIFSLGMIRSDTSYFGAIPLIHYEPSPVTTPAIVVKRIIDVCVSFVLLVILAPLMAAIGVLIKLDSPGPVFFRQRRVGLNGRHFTLLKFRSMVEEAEQLLPELKDRNEMEGPVFKLKDDPRVTRMGRFIRKFSIDELPQLINVLRGDMSLVGPRPPLPEEVSLYRRKHRRRLSMRPGITCIWQVSGRNEIPNFEEWAKLDLEYIDNWSLRADLKLLLRTIPAVLSGTGAR